MKHILEINKNFLSFFNFFGKKRVFYRFFPDIHSKNQEILCSSKNIEKLAQEKPENSNEINEDSSFTSNFLEVIVIEQKNQQNYKDSLLNSYEKTKFSDFSEEKFVKNSAFSEENQRKINNINDGFAFYKLVTTCISKHLSDIEKNELAYLIEDFTQIFELKALKIINKFKRNDLNFKEFILSKQQIIHGFQQFIRVLQETLVLYYNLNDTGNRIPHCSLFTKDNLINFLISFLMENDRIYHKLFDLEALSDNKIEENSKIIYEILQNLDPEDFAIPSQYCLNDKTLNFYQNLQANLKNSRKNTENQNKTQAIPVPEANSPLKHFNSSSSKKNAKKKPRNLQKYKKFSCNEDFLADPCENKILEKTFYSVSSSEIKKTAYNNAKFSFPTRKSSESFMSAKINANNSENNEFISLHNSVVNGEIVNNANNPLEISEEYYSVAMIPENNSNVLQKTSRDNIKPNEISKKSSEILYANANNSTIIEKTLNISSNDNKNTYFPYEKAVQLLKFVHICKKPLEKMKKILDVAEMIKISIKNFYKENHLKNIKSKNLDSDEILAIFLFILVKSGVKSLHVDLKIIENFTTDRILNSKNGYYLMTLQLCLKFVESLNAQELKKLNFEQRKASVLEKTRQWIKEKRINKMMVIGTGKNKE